MILYRVQVLVCVKDCRIPKTFSPLYKISKNLKEAKSEEPAFFILCAFKLDGVGPVNNIPL